MTSPVYVMAHFRVKPDALAEVLALLADLSVRTREEPGCRDYGYYQSQEDPLEFSSFEVWETPQDEAAHWQTQHLRQALAKAAPLLQAAPRICRANRVS